MTNDEKRIAIAEKCGWVWYRIPYHDRETHHRCLCLPALHEYDGQAECWLVRADGSERICNMKYMEDNGHVPNYTEDLNACHEMEKVLTTFQQADYVNFLYRSNTTNKPQYFIHPDCFATAAQRCDAFLLTHGFKL